MLVKDKTLFKGLGFLTICIFFGFLLLLLVYAIPSWRFADEAKDAALVLQEEGTSPNDTISGRPLDNWTDAQMLLECSYQGDSNLVDKVIKSWYNYTDHTGLPLDAFVEINTASPDSFSLLRCPYPRYWHGYQVTLRPLFSVISYSSIRILNYATQTLLLLVSLFLLIRKLPSAFIPFLLAVFYLAPTAVGKSLQYSSCYYVLLIISLIILLKYDILCQENRILYLFLFDGAVTAYLDFLTYPSVTLTLPLALYMALLNQTNRGIPLQLKTGLFICFAWLFGYAGMWAGKWLIAFVYEGEAFVQDLFQTMALRASTSLPNGGVISRIAALEKCFSVLFSDRTLDIITLVFALLMIVKRALFKKWNLLNMKIFLPFAFSFVIPIIWILFMADHSYWHSYYTYRTLAPCIFCILMVLASPPRLRFVQSKRFDSTEEQTEGVPCQK